MAQKAPEKPPTRLIVIDDEDDELDQLPLFQPSAETGLTSEIVRGRDQVP